MRAVSSASAARALVTGGGRACAGCFGGHIASLPQARPPTNVSFRGRCAVSVPDHLGPGAGPVPAGALQTARPPAASPREGDGHREVRGHDSRGKRRRGNRALSRAGRGGAASGGRLFPQRPCHVQPPRGRTLPYRPVPRGRLVRRQHRLSCLCLRAGAPGSWFGEGSLRAPPRGHPAGRVARDSVSSVPRCGLF